MTTYTIGPGETYETFTALEAAVVLAGDDIVDGTPSGIVPFLEEWLPETNGTAGHDITFQNAIIDGDGTRDYCVYTSALSYLVFQDLTCKDAVTTNFYSQFAANPTTFNRIISTGGSIGLRVFGNTNTVFNDISIAGASLRGFYLQGAAVGAVISGLTITNSASGESARFSDMTDVTLSDLTISGGLGLGVFVSSAAGVLSFSDAIIASQSFGFRIFQAGNVDLTLANINSTSIASMGLDISDSTFQAGSEISNCNFSDSGSHGCTVASSSTLFFQTNIFNNNGGDGFDFNGTSFSIEIEDSQTNGNLGDGASGVATAVAVFTRHISNDNGTTGHATFGDGYTAHNSASITVLYSLAKNNLNSASAHINTPEVTHYQCTFIENGIDPVATRGEFWSQCTGGTQTLKNNILMNLNSYPLIKLADGTSVYPVSDYNAYISDSLTPFWDGNQASGSEELTFAQWITASSQDVNSIFIHQDGSDYNVYLGSAPSTIDVTINYNPVLANGKLVKKDDNPLLNAGVVVAGVNDGGELDIWGNATDGTPNIGNYQGEGVSTNKNILGIVGKKLGIDNKRLLGIGSGF